MRNKPERYLTSKEAKSVLKVQDCDLMHIRTLGKLKFVKKGNAFMYSEKSVAEFKEKTSKGGKALTPKNLTSDNV